MLKKVWEMFLIHLWSSILQILLLSEQKKLNEDVIDYDLLEDLICHVDETYPEGAILMFLPVSPLINYVDLIYYCLLKMG